MSKDILDVLAQLDTTNDAQWTGEGLPKIDAVRWLAKDQTITREDVSKAAPGFSRSNPLIRVPEQVTENTIQQPQSGPAEPAQRTATSTDSPAIPEFAGTATVVSNTVGEDANAAELESLTNDLKEVEEDINNAMQAMERGKEYIKTKHEIRDQLVNRIESLTPRRKNQNAITAYLNKQKELVESRAEADRLVKERLKELGGISTPLPIDVNRR